MRKNIKMLSVRAQQGVAAIWMSLVLVPVMGFTFWAVEGTRYVQEKSRLEDASEAAALAVTMTDHEARAEQMASDYVSAYVRDIQGIQLSTVREYQKGTRENQFEEYVQYTVDVTTTHRSWFASQVIPSFEKTQDLKGKSIAKKYPEYLGDRDVDIVFVSDFSNSMNSDWRKCPEWYCDKYPKIDILKNAIEKISYKILSKNKSKSTSNRVAFVPFNLRVQDKIKNRLICNTQLRYNHTDSSNYIASYEEVNWKFWSEISAYRTNQCLNDADECPIDDTGKSKWLIRKEARMVAKVLNALRDIRILEHPSYIDYEKSVRDIYINKVSNYNFHYYSGYNKLYSNEWMCSGEYNSFWTIGLNSELSSLEPIWGMKASGATAAYQGLIRGAQVMADGRPKSTMGEDIKAYNKKIKMILILSDGQEYPYHKILPNLVDHGLCNKIRDAFSDSEQPLYIGVLGINFKASEQSGFQDCVSQPKEDIIDVNNVDDLIQKIEELIKRGARSGGNTKLYG